MTEENWKAFEYEVEMFSETRKLMGRWCELDRISRNALVESALLHTRILIEALLSKSNEPDDITLDKLLPVQNRPAGLDSALAILKTNYGTRNQKSSHCWTLNKRLAHLTATRGDSWNYGELFEQLDPVIQQTLTIVIPCLGRPRLARYA